MKVYTEKDICFLIKQFEETKLPKSEWTHKAHLIVAIWYSTKANFDETLNLVRNYIKKNNIATGTPNTDTSGYHETITVFWLQIAYQFINKKPKKSVTELCNIFINSQIAKNDLPLEYYTKDVLFSVKARREFIKPNFKEIN